MKFKPECSSISEIAQYLLDCALELSRIADESQTASATARNGRLQPESDNSLLYAVYAAEGNGSYLAVCLDDPFCYASGRDRESAINGLLEAIREKYGCGHVLDGIEVPDFLPEDL